MLVDFNINLFHKKQIHSIFLCYLYSIILLIVSIFFILILFPSSLLSKESFPVKYLKHTKNSVLFYNVDKDKIIYEYNPNLLLTPASIVKLTTSSTLLDIFPTSKKFTTTISYTKEFNKAKKTITGDLIIIGGGDPLLTNEKLEELFQDLYSMGVENIEGDLLIDNNLFDDNYFPSDRNSKLHSSRAYNSPVSSLAINFNTLTISIYPGNIGSLALVNIYPVTVNNVKIINEVKTVKGSKTKISLDRSTNNKGEETIKVSGYISYNSKLIKKYCSIGNVSKTLGEFILSFLRKENIKIQGKIRNIDSTKIQSSSLIEYSGDPLSKIITALNQYSNNFIADTLTKHLSLYLYPDKKGSLDNGVKIINDFLKEKVNIKTTFSIVDGSGLSTKNKLSSKQIVDILKYMYQRKDLFPEFLNSLAISEEDGSLKERSFKKKIRAKTGTLTVPVSVSNIAGYGWNDNNDLIIFSILENGSNPSNNVSIEELRSFQNKMIDSFIR